jgi:hypothetical protein
MKLVLTLQKDSSNSYPKDIEFAEGTEDKWMFIIIDQREVAVDKIDFLRMCAFFLTAPATGQCVQTQGTGP